MGRAGIEPATQTRRFYRPLPTPIGEPTHEAVPTGVEPANPGLKDLWLYQFAYGTTHAQTRI